jgi:ethanolamine utilization protein EutP (predicted NTPase)
MDNIILDFDGTLTKNVQMWQSLIPIMQQHAHVLVVTQRDCNQENIETVEQWLMENGFDYLVDRVIFTSAAPKFYYLEKMNIKPWILIDDDPKRAVNGF